MCVMQFGEETEGVLHVRMEENREGGTMSRPSKGDLVCASMIRTVHLLARQFG